jgi:hypothetical protein
MKKQVALLEAKYKASETIFWNNQEAAQAAGAKLSGFHICVIGSSTTPRGIAVTQALERMNLKCDWIPALPIVGDVSDSGDGRSFTVRGLPDVTAVHLERGVYTNTASLELAMAIAISHVCAVNYMVKQYPGESFLVTEDDVFWPAAVLWPCTLGKVWEDRPPSCQVLSLNSTWVPSRAGPYFPWKSPPWGTHGVVYMWGSQAVIYSAQGGRNFVESLLDNTVMKVKTQYTDSTTPTIMVIDHLTPVVTSKASFVANHNVLHCSLPEDVRLTPFSSLEKLQIQLDSVSDTMGKLLIHHNRRVGKTGI